MDIPYAFIKVLSGEGNPFLDSDGKSAKQQAEYLMTSPNMRGLHLGACLDSPRWGGRTTIMYEMSVRGLISFIQSWAIQNPYGIPDLVHERGIDELFTRFELPYINHKTCPRDEKHRGTLMDMGGRIRCGHTTIQTVKPSFTRVYDKGFDKLSEMDTLEMYEHEPEEPLTWGEDSDCMVLVDDEGEIRKYKEEKERYNGEEPFRIIDPCYAMISDKGKVLSLEKIISRLNLEPPTVMNKCPSERSKGGFYDESCRRLGELTPRKRRQYEELDRCLGHEDPNEKTIFPFDGWTLAFYVLRWHQQLPNGQAPLFDNKPKIRSFHIEDEPLFM